MNHGVGRVTSTSDAGAGRTCDVLIIGGGGAGCLAAFEASCLPDLRVILVSRGPIGQSGLTPTANGGTHTVGEKGGPVEFFREMITAGRFLNDQDVTWFMANECGPRIERLRTLDISVTRYADASCCVPGVEMLRKLRRVLKSRENVELLEDIMVTSLLNVEGRIAGGTVLDLRTGRFFVISTASVVLATGGMAGELYAHTSNNPFGVTTDASGTGHAMAYRAGAELVDMEMMQFVPLPMNARALHLRYFPDFWEEPYVNSHGEVVEDNVGSYPGRSYSYQLVQKIWRECEKGNGPIYIDQRGSGAPKAGGVVRSWAMRRNLIKTLGIDPREHKIELVIGSHFNTGGVRINPRTETTVKGLFAAGEVTGCVHGALRLAGYSFTQMIVFGFEAGRQAAGFAAEHPKSVIVPRDHVARERERVFRFFEARSGAISAHDLRRRLQRVMEEHFFIVRDGAGMSTGIREIEEIRQDLARVAVPPFKRFNLEWARAVDLDLMVEAAQIMASSALAREESRGFHWRSDFPGEDNQEWLTHTVASLDWGVQSIRTSPVIITDLRPEV
jgi:succinate dehydrogenase/fumarate reductase flavoprotein subunit